MSKQALNYLLRQMESLGYLRRDPDDSDHRSKRVKLTARGNSAIDAIREIVTEVENEWEAQLGPEPFWQLRDLLTQLRAIAATPDAEPTILATSARAQPSAGPGHCGDP